ncbi:similar to TRICHOME BIREFRINGENCE-LIKE 34 [Actinidia rufa]|uniref:Similar to TRICHOME BIREFRINGENCE-LIKE 34 n=1 Tax=Actinidia rufa TaxID=165716 RepID=A0A7J0GF97_9ERIC|nr:similar to TRICHOME BIREFRINGENCE-LIKE 34 [Actinidia rufa]
MSAKIIQVVPKSRGLISCSFHSLVAAVLVAVFMVSAFYTTREKNLPVKYHPEPAKDAGESANYQMATENKTASDGHREEEKSGGGSISGCDLFSGKWVFDNKSFPMYKEQDCSFIDDGIACEKFGRKDLKYQHWRWQPRDCDLPRFNATAMLERLRGKRLVFTGDSLNWNQWVSMVCLVQSQIPPALKSMHINGSLMTFVANEYNATIDFYWAPLLVESNSDDLFHHRIPDRIIRAQAIEKHARHWTDADILVFNSYLWWRRPTLKVLWGSFEIPDGIYKDVEMLRSYEMALRTWSDWLDIHINRAKTKLFFMSMSPTHDRADDWGMPASQNCNNETEPISKQGYWGIDSDPRMMRLVEASIDELKTRGLKVQLLNITQISEYRKDAHPSIHRMQWGSKEEMSNPIRYADCTHWCLPGVPDVWNTLLYTYIFHD